MAKRKRPTVAAEVPSDLLDAVHRVPWGHPYLSIDEIDGWQARVAQLLAHHAYTKACAEVVAGVSTTLHGLDWSTMPAAFVAGCIEANVLAQRGADRLVPLVLDPDQRTRRTWYTAWWLLHCWERGLPPEPLLALLVIAFEGGPPALAELWRRGEAQPVSFTVGLVRVLEDAGDDAMLAQVFKAIRRLAWRKTPTALKANLARKDLYAELDAATWEVLQERCAAITPLETLFLGLDNRLGDIPGVVGNRLRQQRLLEPTRRDLEIEIDPRPTPPEALPTLGMDTLLRALEARAAPATLAALTRPESDAAIAAAYGISPKTIQRDRQQLREYLKRLI